MQTIYLQTPIQKDAIEALHVGDSVYITGRIFTSRDMGHLRIQGLLEGGQALPEDLEGSAVFHAGPVVEKEGEGYKLRVIGPTTSIRMEPYAQMVGELGVRAIIGKGGMAAETLANAAKYKYVYLQAAPGCAVQLAAGVKAVERVHWLDLGVPEAMWVLDVKDFGPLVVAMDAHGKSLYDDVRANARAEKARIAAGGGAGG